MPQTTAQAHKGIIEITASELPLHCPQDERERWSSHPRVFLAIEATADSTARCPYCGTVYRLGT